MLTARWLGKGLIALAGTRETATAQVDTYRPTGLQIVDTRNWSVRTLDPRADTFMVADGSTAKGSPPTARADCCAGG
jgi:hypothetical protein